MQIGSKNTVCFHYGQQKMKTKGQIWTYKSLLFIL